MSNEDTKKAETFAFETHLAELEAIVTSMENQTLGLEEALKHYEKGLKLSKRLEKSLLEAEQRIRILSEENTLQNAPHLTHEADLETSD